jgi:hypothetical protein
VTWTESYYQHYAKFFGTPSATTEWASENEGPPLRILTFDNVIRGCRIFATVGLAQYQSNMQGPCELYVPVDEAWDAMPEIVGNLARFAVRNGLVIHRGQTIAGISNINFEFASTYDKEALYVTDPYELPGQLGVVQRGAERGRLYAGLLVSEGELAFTTVPGALSLDEALDIFHLDRYMVARRSML